jgi:hypothetical protein
MGPDFNIIFFAEAKCIYNFRHPSNGCPDVKVRKIRLQTSNTTMAKTMLLTSKQKSIAQLFDEIFWEKF